VTPQEEQLLNSLVERVNQTQLQEKDPDAEALLNQSLGSNPDALYIMAQTVLVQNIALDQARAQLIQLQQQSRPQPAQTTSFLGRLLGDRDPEPARPQPPPYQPVPNYGPPQPQYAQPQYQQPQYVPYQAGPPSFLRGAMQTAAGVAAGALAFEGVEAILHGFGGHGGYGLGGAGYGIGGFGRPVEETVINNYYDEPGSRGAEHMGEQHEHGGAQFSDAGYSDPGDGGDNLRGFDNGTNVSDFADSNLDDGLGLDDSGAFDSGGGFDSDDMS
jgi:hypothetical protein